MEGNQIKKGQKIKINLNLGCGIEEVVVMSDFDAGVSNVKFIQLKRSVGASYTITQNRLLKCIVQN